MSLKVTMPYSQRAVAQCVRDIFRLGAFQDVQIYGIGIVDDSGSLGMGRSGRALVEELSDLTGGRSFFPNQASELNAIYGQIADELSSQYTVGYTSRNPKRDGAWRRVVVRANRANSLRSCGSG